ncbi:Glucose/Sorbosone dehydrogenase [Podospora fimiseda]|uniref:Glucose/Sorbosone dehydrogenase n=1 Tax=Podospora fimiseda TaxID=252190 RepID=A0AAN7GWL9_9PEZI|nr:Glucose/Sorbosone dehydrogenase [Podospora fimiseda]
MMMFGLSTTCALALVSGAWAIPSQVSGRQAAFRSTAITDFASPWALAFLPDNRILVTEKAGQLRLLDPNTKAKGTVTGVPRVRNAGQGGFGDVALHPNYAENNLIYISYSEPGSGTQANAAVARAKLVLNNSGGGALQDLQVIWRQNQQFGGDGHFSHRLLFDSNNSTLFISSGERQQFDPAQSLTSNLGKIIRLNDDGTPKEGNPYFSRGGVSAQIWALGVRNPLGIDWDEQGRLWEIEMGPQGGDEINLIEKGGNYGWPIVSQGNHYDGRPIPNHNTRPEFIPPKAFWVPVISPSSLVIYKGDLFRNWKGNAIISGLGAQGLVRVEITGNNAREVQRLSLGKRIRSVRQGPDGALYVLEDGQGGRLLKLTPN